MARLPWQSMVQSGNCGGRSLLPDYRRYAVAVPGEMAEEAGAHPATVVADSARAFGGGKWRWKRGRCGGSAQNGGC